MTQTASYRSTAVRVRTHVAILLATAASLVAGSLDAQAPATPLVLVAGVGDYSGESYTEGPVAPADYVFFQGEMVTLDVRIANWSGGSEEVALPDTPARLFSITGSRDASNHDGTMPVPVIVAPTMWRDEVSRRVAIPYAARVRLAAGDELCWRVTLTESTLSPGVYPLEVDTIATDTRGRPVRRQAARFTFEVRAAAAALPAELARRHAERLAAAGDYPAAKAAVIALEQVYPDSVAVHLIRSRIADAEGDSSQYRRSIELARTFLREDRDGLMRHFARPGQLEDLIDSLAP